MKRIKCQKCGHEQETRSILMRVTCSNCGSKILAIVEKSKTKG